MKKIIYKLLVIGLVGAIGDASGTGKYLMDFVDDKYPDQTNQDFAMTLP